MRDLIETSTGISSSREEKDFFTERVIYRGGFEKEEDSYGRKEERNGSYLKGCVE